MEPASRSTRGARVTGSTGAGWSVDPRLHHDVSVVLGLPWSRAAPLVPPLADDVLRGAYGASARVRFAALLHPPTRGRRRWLPRRLDEGAAASRLAAMPAEDVADSLRELAETPGA